MTGFLWVFAVLCGFAYLLNKRASSQAPKQSQQQCQRQFVVDVCDGNQRRAERLMTEKARAHPGLGASQILQLVYQDMLELTVEERTAAAGTQRAMP
ncbi:hypothetical protein PMI16_03971 [Herbaspirillum sp. CF444]|uniref:hypothetical protein n=1 Tax=Herbaspirillum sp. CF444 TaxID=1144319 RepID=UPI0002727981|nr:hypothetical protein [Herbaspirillum sp. CF444]EJL84230.1 hypothetical protein PMI16_03971 [Herbaspirillum sp. CF444]